MRRSGFLLLLALGAVGCAGPAPRPAASPRAVPVEVRQVERRTLVEVLSASGSVQAVASADVASKVPGRVVEVLVQEGSPVREGQVLVRLDASDAWAQVQQAEAALAAARARVPQAALAAELVAQTAADQVRQAQAGVEAARAQVALADAQVAAAESARALAEADLQRVQQLFAQGAVAAQQVDAARAAAEAARAQHEASQAQRRAAEEQLRSAQAALRVAESNRQQASLRQRDVEQAQAAVRQAEATVRLARLQVQNLTVRSPLSGLVTQRNVDPGEYAAPGVPLLTVADTSTVRVQLVVSETQVERLRPGQPVRVTVDALPGRSFLGRVEDRSPTADPHTRTFLVRVRIANPDGALRPGMFARGHVEVQRRVAVPAVPAEALVYEGRRAFVFVVNSGVARRRPVQPGLVAESWVEVTGVAAGEEVVVAGQSLLRDGSAVVVQR